MKVTYDPEANVVYIKVKDKKPVDSLFPVKGMLLSLDENGDVVSIEFLRASDQVDNPLEVEYVDYTHKTEPQQ